MGLNAMQCPAIVADLTVANKFGIIVLPSRIVRVRAVAAGTLRGRATPESHVVLIIVGLNVVSIFIVPDELAKLVIVIKSGRVSGMLHRADTRSITGTVGHNILIPMTILAHKRTGEQNRRRICIKRTKRADGCNQVGIVTGNTVLWKREVAVVVPAVIENIGGAVPVVATVATCTHRAVPVHDNTRWVGNDIVAGLTYAVFPDQRRIMVPVGQILAMALPTVVFR